MEEKQSKNPLGFISKPKFLLYLAHYKQNIHEKRENHLVPAATYSNI